MVSGVPDRFSAAQATGLYRERMRSKRFGKFVHCGSVKRFVPLTSALVTIGVQIKIRMGACAADLRFQTIQRWRRPAWREDCITRALATSAGIFDCTEN